jgi:hypothetical protein
LPQEIYLSKVFQYQEILPKKKMAFCGFLSGKHHAQKSTICFSNRVANKRFLFARMAK